MSTLPLEALKGVINLYDIITYPVYYLTQQPWKKVAKMNAVRAVQEDPSDPYSPWIRVGKAPTCLAEGCETIDELLRKCIKTYYNRNAFGYRKILKEEKVIQNDGRTFYKRALEPKYTWLTYGEIDKRIDDIMRGILINGIKPGDRVVIFMETRMEWMLFAQALYRMGATLATVYATLGDEGVIHVIEEVQSTHLLTSSDLLSKVKSIRHRLSKLKTVIYCEDSIHPEPMTSYGLHEVDLQLVRFDHLEYQGSQADASLKGIPPKGDDIALIMYTSGSTGVPKGVSAYHKNTIAACMSLYTVLSQIDVRDGDYSISYLPLAHNLEFTTEHLNFCLGSGIGFASPLTLTDQSLGLLPGSIGDISILKPGALITVPLILDRIRKAVLEKIEKKGPFARDLFNFCLEYKLNWQKRGFKTPIMDKLVFGKIAGGFGGQIRGIFSGGAPLPASVHSFAASTLNAVMMQGYGLTETTAIGTLMDMDDFSTGKVGAPLFGCKIRLVDWDEGGYRVTDEPRSRGEIVIGGPCLAAGYFNQPEQTAEVFKVEDGYRWFYTGDIGEFYPDGKHVLKPEARASESEKVCVTLSAPMTNVLAPSLSFTLTFFPSLSL